MSRKLSSYTQREDIFALMPEFHLNNLKCDLHLDFLVSVLFCLHEAIPNAASWEDVKQ